MATLPASLSFKGRRIILVTAFLALVLITFWSLQPFRLLPPWSASSQPSVGSPYIFKGPNAQDKAIIIAKMSYENVSWVSEELPDWQHAIYHMDDPSAELHPPSNKGREAMAYLTYLIDHHDVLPEISLFLHPHRSGWPAAWHTDAKDYDNVISAQSLQLNYVQQHGYANMRCIAIPGCPDEIQPFRAHLDRPYEVAFREAYKYMFQVAHDIDVPQIVATPCCSQFAVSRSQILNRPLSDYIRYRQWLLDTHLGSNDSGRVLEYMWHIIFGKGPVWCPEHEQCWCQQFGRC